MQIILHNQSLLDVALQHTGTIESLFELALANGISITDDLTAGTPLILPPAPSQGRGVSPSPSGRGWGGDDILNYYSAKNIQPATAFTQEDKQLTEKPEGISIWAINLDFKVSE